MSDDTISMRILLIDDEQDILDTIGTYLSDVGHRVHLALSGPAAMEILRRETVDIVITDLKMPQMDGFEVLRQIRSTTPGTEVIMVTGHGDIEAAVQAMRQGAFDFFSKPVKLRELSASLERTMRFHALRREKEHYQQRLERLNEAGQELYGLEAIIGQSAAIQEVKQRIEQVCQSDATSVLIYGETGTGKELVAQAIHYGSTRSAEEFVAVNCTAIPESLAESELYGHAKGAFTDARKERKGRFELAHGGTIFLDEIGDMSLEIQARLLRTLEERCIQRVGEAEDIPVDVRVISATNRDLLEGIDEGQFREDLYYRLNTFTIRIPALRQRREDIPLLAQHFIKRYGQEMRKSIGGFDDEALELLENYAFPGNIRELRNVIEHAVILCQGELVTPEELHFDPPRQSAVPQEMNSLNLAEVEKNLIERALQECGGNQVQAAKTLGITRDTLRRRIERYNLL